MAATYSAAPRCTACGRRIRYARPTTVSGLIYGRTCGRRLLDALSVRVTGRGTSLRVTGPARLVVRGATIRATQSGKLVRVQVIRVVRESSHGIEATVSRTGDTPTPIPAPQSKPAAATPARSDLAEFVSRPLPVGPGSGPCAQCGRYARVRWSVQDIHGVPGDCCASCTRMDWEERSFN